MDLSGSLEGGWTGEIGAGGPASSGEALRSTGVRPGDAAVGRTRRLALRWGDDGCRSADDQRTILRLVPCSRFPNRWKMPSIYIHDSSSECAERVRIFSATGTSRRLGHQLARCSSRRGAYSLAEPPTQRRLYSSQEPRIRQQRVDPGPGWNFNRRSPVSSSYVDATTASGEPHVKTSVLRA